MGGGGRVLEGCFGGEPQEVWKKLSMLTTNTHGGETACNRVKDGGRVNDGSLVLQSAEARQFSEWILGMFDTSLQKHFSQPPTWDKMKGLKETLNIKYIQVSKTMQTCCTHSILPKAAHNGMLAFPLQKLGERYVHAGHKLMH